MQDRVYSNKYFGFQMGIPPDWKQLDSQQRQILAKSKTDMVGEHNHDHQIKKQLGSAKLSLFNWFEKSNSLKASRGVSANILAYAERIKTLEIRSAKEYLGRIIKVMKRSVVNYKLPKELDATKFDATNFSMFMTEATVFEQTIKQRYYARLFKGYVLLIIVSWQTDEQLRTINKSLETMRFKLNQSEDP